MDYYRLARGFPGWDIVNIKNLPVREREYWLSLVDYRREMEQWHRLTEGPQQAVNQRWPVG